MIKVKDNEDMYVFGAPLSNMKTNREVAALEEEAVTPAPKSGDATMLTACAFRFLRSCVRTPNRIKVPPKVKKHSKASIAIVFGFDLKFSRLAVLLLRLTILVL
jgi:hypothetical protein